MTGPRPYPPGTMPTVWMPAPRRRNGRAVARKPRCDNGGEEPLPRMWLARTLAAEKPEYANLIGYRKGGRE